MNHNVASNLSFKLEIPEENITNYFIRSAGIPDVSVTEIETHHHANSYWVPSNKITYSPLNCELILDEELEVYTRLLGWINRIRQTEGQHTLMRDLILHILKNDKSTMKVFKFYHAFPTQLGELQFTTSGMESELLVLNATFRYTHFDILDPYTV